MTMNVADQDRLELEKLVDEATQLRSREAFSALVEVAYVLGRRTGFAECRTLVLAPTERPSLSESEAK